MEKKDSIFSGLSPVPAHITAPAARPAASDQEVAALKQKIEALEKQVKAQVSQPAAPKPPDSGQVMLARISDLEKKLEDFSRNVLMSSVQMKNIEESKISARREIEELLKVVREQQKYTEMDRQMHDQAEKAWSRVEDLEKKLMEFYASSVSKTSDETKAALVAAEVERTLGSKLQRLAEEMELKFKSVAAKMDETSPAVARRSEERISAMVSNLDVKLAAFETEFRKVHLNISSSEAAIQSLYSDIRVEMQSVVRDSMREETGEVRKYIDGFVVDTEARMDGMSRLITAQIDAMLLQTRQEGAKLEKIGTSVDLNMEKSRAALSALGGELEGALRKYAVETGERIRSESARNAGEIMEFSRLSAFSLASATALAANLDGLNARLSKLKETLKTFVDGMKGVKLESVLGVSGALIRKNFAGIQDALAGMDQDLAVFDRIKGEITSGLKDIARKPK